MHPTVSFLLPHAGPHHVRKSVLCVSIAPLQIVFISTVFLDSIYLRVSSFSFGLTSLCMIGSRFTHLTRANSNAFLFMAEQYAIVYIYYSFFIHSSVDGHLGCCRVLTVVNSAAMNMGVHVFFSILVSAGYIPSSGISES